MVKHDGRLRSIDELLNEIADKIFADYQLTRQNWFDNFVEVKNLLVGQFDENTICSSIDKPAQRLRQRELEVGDSTALNDFLKEFYIHEIKDLQTIEIS